MKRLRLTNKQRALQKEVSALLKWLRVTTDLTRVKAADRTNYLTWAKRELIITAVLRQYLLIDEHLNNEICWDFFPRRTYAELWRTKRFRAFSNHILDRLALLPKLEFVRVRIRLSNRFYNDIRDLNALRNALAHSFFPENRRVKPKWRGVDIFSFAGVGQFINDTSAASAFFFARLRRQRRYPPRWK
jgi:hypothetical protein